jgi:hypothetical protein
VCVCVCLCVCDIILQLVSIYFEEIHKTFQIFPDHLHFLIIEPDIKTT